MIVLLGIVCAHLLVILRARMASNDRVPYATIFTLTALMVVFVVAMMYSMEPPE